MPIAVHIAVEDDLSETVLRRLLHESRRGYVVRTRYPTSRRSHAPASPSGFGYLKKHLISFNQAAHVIPFVVLTDLDQHPCPATLASAWLPRPLHPNLMFRVAVREVESWLLSDPASMADFLQIPARRIPADPEGLADPKAELVALARMSRNSEIRGGLAPAPVPPAWALIFEE